MPKFSASKATVGKVAYKGFVERDVSMAELAELARDHSLTSYIYGDGETSGGEKCSGHRAWGSVIGAGDVLFMDFDDKGATFDMIVEGLEAKGVAGWVGPSKSWSESVLKFHAAVQFDRELPMGKEMYETLYKATMQFLGFTAWYDPCMEGASQQMAPHWHAPGSCPEVVLEGEMLDMAEVMASYVPREGDSSGERGAGSGERISGEGVPPETIFTLSADGRKVGIKEMLAMVASGEKVRVHCIAGLKHDGREDTALVRGSDDGTAYYHCTGGRCGKTLVIRDPQPFEEAEAEADEVVVVTLDKRTVWTAVKGIEHIIADDPAHARVYGGKGIKDKDREMAVSYGCQKIVTALDLRWVEDNICQFNGVLWEPVFADDAAMLGWVQSAFRAAGFAPLANNLTAVSAVLKLVKMAVPLGKCEKPRNVIGAMNGMLNLDTMTLEPHDKEQLLRAVLPFNYDKTAQCPEWLSFVDRIMLGSESLKLALQDAMGYLFARNLHLELMIGLVGSGANGKSTLIEVMSKLVGENGAAHVPLHLLTKTTGEGAYARAALAGKYVNFTNELSPSALASNEFKDIISGKSITARNPYGRPFTVHLMPKQVCAMNSTDNLIKERTHGFMRRLYLVPFNYTVKAHERDRNLLTKLEMELAGILNWVLEGTVRVLRNAQLSVAPEMEILLDNIKLDSNPVQQFLEERTAPHTLPLGEVKSSKVVLDGVVGVAELYALYREFCEDNAYKILGRNAFSKEVERLGVTKTNVSVKVNSAVQKASGFWLKILKPNDYRHSGEKSHLVLVT